MLVDKYLPNFTYATKHSIIIHASPEKIFSIADSLDMSGSPIIRLLFKLRGMSSQMLTKEGLNTGRFAELEKIKNEELIIGLIGQFWNPSGNLQLFSPHEFIPFNKPSFLKAVWSFTIRPVADHRCALETETRIFCPDDHTRKKFSRYWFFIKPFSGVIRSEILRGMKHKAESL
jgi:hypothetical protein